MDKIVVQKIIDTYIILSYTYGYTYQSYYIRIKTWTSIKYYLLQLLLISKC